MSKPTEHYECPRHGTHPLASGCPVCTAEIKAGGHLDHDRIATALEGLLKVQKALLAWEDWEREGGEDQPKFWKRAVRLTAEPLEEA